MLTNRCRVIAGQVQSAAAAVLGAGIAVQIQPAHGGQQHKPRDRAC